MGFGDVWNRTLVYFGIAEEEDEWDEDGYLTEEDLERTYSERPNVRRLTPRRQSSRHDFDPGLGEDRQLLDRDVLRRRDDRDRVADLGADALVTLPNLVRRQRYASSSVGKRSVLGTGISSRYRTSPATEASTPCTPLGFPSRRCEKNSSGLHAVQRSRRSICATPALRSARSAACQRSSFRPRVIPTPKRLR